MKSEKWISGLIAVILATAIALGGVGCIVTGFALEPDDMVHLLWLTVLVSTTSALCLSLPFGELLLTVLSLLALGISLRHGDLLISLEKALNHITSFYDSAYGWGYIRWSTENLRWAEPDTALLMMAALLSMSTCWVVLRRQWFGFAILAGLLPLVACCIVTDTPPADGWLWLLLTALLLLTMTQLLRRISPRDANRLTALLLIPVLLFTTSVFRFTSQNALLGMAQGLQQDLLTILTGSSGTIEPGTGPTGPIISRPSLSTTVDLSALGSFHSSGATVMTVTASNWDGTLYLRGQAYDTYTGLSWEATLGSIGDNGWPTEELKPHGHLTITTGTSLPLRYFPYYMDLPNWYGQMQDGHLPNPEGQKSYAFGIYTTSGRAPNGLQEEALFTALPEQTLTDARRILSDIGIRLPAADAGQVAARVAAYVRSSAIYDQSTGPMPDSESDFALWFLEDGDTGYCVHFATATSVLMRAAGIPARYVTGYMTQVISGAECAVPDSQAHAWVEYYHPYNGWTVLEATPAEPEPPIIITPPTTQPPETTSPPETTQPPATTQPPDTTGPSQTTQPSQTVDPTGSTAPPETTAPGSQAARPTEPATQIPFWQQLNLKWIRGILWAAAIWLLIYGQYKLRLKLRKRRMHTGTPNQQAVCRWRYVRRIARVSGLSAGELLPLAEKAAFSQHQLTREELAQFDAWFPKASQALLKKPWLIQFLLRLIFAVA